MKSAIDLDLKYLDMIRQILRAHLPASAKVFMFGSRTTGRAKPFSDIDLLINSNKELTLHELAQLNTAFDDALLPYKVDIADANLIAAEFKAAIKDQLVAIDLFEK